MQGDIRQQTATLIAASYSEEDAQAYIRFDSRPHLDQLASIGREVLDLSPRIPNACAHMVAVWVSLARVRTGLPVYQVAGDLFAAGRIAFGSDATPAEVAAAFNESQAAWDGHCWMSIGNHVGDLSVFRTAYARPLDSRLRAVITRHFGEGRGLMLAPIADWQEAELEYRPKYVVTEAQLDSLFRGACELFTRGRF